MAADGEVLDVTGLARLQRRALEAEREQIVALHAAGKINDEVFAGLEEELDWSEAALDQTRNAEAVVMGCNKSECCSFRVRCFLS